MRGLAEISWLRLGYLGLILTRQTTRSFILKHKRGAQIAQTEARSLNQSEPVQAWRSTHHQEGAVTG